MDISVTLSAAQAMQVQAALDERITKLYRSRTAPGSFERECVVAALVDAKAAYEHLTDALYPGDTSEFAGDHYAGMEHLPSSAPATPDRMHVAATGAPPVRAGAVYEGMD